MVTEQNLTNQAWLEFQFWEMRRASSLVMRRVSPSYVGGARGRNICAERLVSKLCKERRLQRLGHEICKLRTSWAVVEQNMSVYNHLL